VSYSPPCLDLQRNPVKKRNLERFGEGCLPKFHLGNGVFACFHKVVGSIETLWPSYHYFHVPFLFLSFFHCDSLIAGE
jgi:hypothetical protein